jgi:hypothetical protein
MAKTAGTISQMGRQNSDREELLIIIWCPAVLTNQLRGMQ